MWIGIAIFGVLFLFISVIVLGTYGKLWFQAYMSSADINILSLVGMGFRQVNPSVILSRKNYGGASGAGYQSSFRHQHCST